MKEKGPRLSTRSYSKLQASLNSLAVVLYTAVNPGRAPDERVFSPPLLQGELLGEGAGRQGPGGRGGARLEGAPVGLALLVLGLGDRGPQAFLRGLVLPARHQPGGGPQQGDLAVGDRDLGRRPGGEGRLGLGQRGGVGGRLLPGLLLLEGLLGKSLEALAARRRLGQLPVALGLLGERLGGGAGRLRLGQEGLDGDALLHPLAQEEEGLGLLLLLAGERGGLGRLRRLLGGDLGGLLGLGRQGGLEGGQGGGGGGGDSAVGGHGCLSRSCAYTLKLYIVRHVQVSSIGMQALRP